MDWDRASQWRLVWRRIGLQPAHKAACVSSNGSRVQASH